MSAPAATSVLATTRTQKRAGDEQSAAVSAVSKVGLDPRPIEMPKPTTPSITIKGQPGKSPRIRPSRSQAGTICDLPSARRLERAEKAPNCTAAWALQAYQGPATARHVTIAQPRARWRRDRSGPGRNTHQRNGREAPARSNTAVNFVSRASPVASPSAIPVCRRGQSTSLPASPKASKTQNARNVSTITLPPKDRARGDANRNPRASKPAAGPWYRRARPTVPSASNKKGTTLE